MASHVSIGDFSRITHLSVKTLRHYHDVGLVEPDHVDPGSGYRYYSHTQIPTAQVVRRLRELGRHDSVRAITTRVDYGSTGRSIDEDLTPAELDGWMFDECSDAQHASGTCRMGARDNKRSVVDPECRVIGCSGLRVIDASVMPEVVRANTHLTTVMMAEKMADRLKAGA